MTDRKKKLVKILCLCAGIALVTLLACNVSINGDPTSAGGCVCISFDKWDMLRADKVVVHFQGQTYTVTDPNFVRSFAGDTLAGTYTDYCCAILDDGWVEIYRGDRLIRHMRFIDNHGALAYKADALHWVLFGDEGHAFLSQEMDKQLRQLIELG